MSKNRDLGNLVNGLFVSLTKNVGIGTTSPTVALDVVGAGKFSEVVTASSLIKSGGTSAQYLMADGSVSTLTNLVTDSVISSIINNADISKVNEASRLIQTQRIMMQIVLNQKI